MGPGSMDSSMTDVTMDSSTPDVSMPDATLPSIPVLQLIKTAQAQHGLRNGDYQRYRFFLEPVLWLRVLTCCFLIQLIILFLSLE